MKTARVLSVLVLGLVSVSPAAEGIWRAKTPMPSITHSLSVSVVDRKIYAIGGTQGGPTLATVYEYDPATDTWTNKASMPIGRTHLATCEVNGKIYAIGGMNAAIGGGISRRWTCTTRKQIPGQGGPICQPQDPACPPLRWIAEYMPLVAG